MSFIVSSLQSVGLGRKTARVQIVSAFKLAKGCALDENENSWVFGLGLNF